MEGWITALNGLIPWNLGLHGKRVFADVLKLRILRLGDYPAQSRWALNATTSVLRFDTGEKGNGGRDLSEVAKCQGMQAATRGGRSERRIVLWSLKRGHSPAHTLVLGHSTDFRLLVSRTRREDFSTG